MKSVCQPWIKWLSRVKEWGEHRNHRWIEETEEFCWQGSGRPCEMSLRQGMLLLLLISLAVRSCRDLSKGWKCWTFPLRCPFSQPTAPMGTGLLLVISSQPTHVTLRSLRWLSSLFRTLESKARCRLRDILQRILPLILSRNFNNHTVHCLARFPVSGR